MYLTTSMTYTFNKFYPPPEHTLLLDQGAKVIAMTIQDLAPSWVDDGKAAGALGDGWGLSATSHEGGI